MANLLHELFEENEARADFLEQMLQSRRACLTAWGPEKRSARDSCERIRTMAAELLTGLPGAPINLLRYK